MKRSLAVWLTLVVLSSCTGGHPEELCKECGEACCAGPHQDEYQEGPFRVWISHVRDSLHWIHIAEAGVREDSLLLPYPVYRFDVGDLNGDGELEICVGVIKPTYFWPVPDRRLYIYGRHEHRGLMPLWRGSRVWHPLLDFRVCRDSLPACVHTVERDKDSLFYRVEYKLGGFGLVYQRTLSGPEVQSY